jgi:hypothetical protein
MKLGLVLLAACGAAAAPEPRPATPTEGLAIAIYRNGARSYGVVDDRREIEVAGTTVFLDRIDPAAALQSLVIEPLGSEPIHVLSCVRERVDDSPAALAQLAEARGERRRRVIVLHDVHDHSPDRFHYEDTNDMEPAVLPAPAVLSPIVRCKVRARAGKHLVRVLHVTSSLGFQTQHDLTMTDAEHARVATRYAIATPVWRARANVTLFEGVPGDETPPHELARSTIVLDGSTAIVAGAPREFAARLRSIYDGTKPQDGDDLKPTDITWGQASRRQVWVWLELPDARLPLGPLRAHVELPGQPVRELAIAAELRVQTADLTRYPLWIDEDLLGTRKRSVERADGVMIADRVALTVANLGTQPREVWIEERLRSPRRRVISQSWPAPPTLVKDIARVKLTLAPGQTERLGFTVVYDL